MATTALSPSGSSAVSAPRNTWIRSLSRVRSRSFTMSSFSSSAWSRERIRASSTGSAGLAGHDDRGARLGPLERGLAQPEGGRDHLVVAVLGLAHLGQHALADLLQ